MKTKETISEIRSSAVAGSFYPLNKQALEKQLDSFFEKTELEYKGEKILGIIVPHAGYIYSGQTAMYGYKQLYLDLLLRQEDSFKVIILAPAHKEYFKGISISNVDYFRTPLGDVKVNSSNIPFQAEEYVQKKEHSIEVQLPFLQYIFKKANKEFSIVPILVGDVNQEEIKRIAKDINNEITENTIIIVSSDLSHYLSEEQARKIDQITIHYILDSNAKSNSKLDACGEKPILLLQEIAKERKWNNFPVLLNYSNSGDTTKDKTAVVGYASISYTDNSTHLLLRLAHRSIQNIFDSRGDNFKGLETSIPKENLEKKGTFVTLTIHKQLRGCIGNTTASKTVFQGIIDNAKFAAFQDPRFNELKEREFDNTDIEVSILSKPTDCTLEDIKKGDGVIVKQGVASAIYLPQVWEQLPNKEAFMSSLCEKAGLESNCYKEKETKLQRFTVEIIE